MATPQNGEHCALHDQPYAVGEDCPRCAAVKAIPVVASQPESSEALDAEMLKSIEKDLEYAKFLHDKGKSAIGLPGESNWHGWNSAAKLISEGTKLKYQALAEKARISERAHARYLVEHEKDVRSLRRGKGN